MHHSNTGHHTGNVQRDVQPRQGERQAAPLYTREAFRALLARQPEWTIRAALEDGNIPSSNVVHALEWLDELARAGRRG